MKKIICLALILVMTLTLVACFDKPEDIYTKSEGVMTWEEYNAADLNDEVTIEAYIQGKQAWWAKDGVGRGTFYLQDGVGGYLAYELLCTEEEYANLAVGTKVRISGYKAMWGGEVEIIDGFLTGHKGTISEISEDETEVTVIVSTIGREMPVSLYAKAIKKI